MVAIKENGKRKSKCHKTSTVNLTCHFFIHLIVNRYFCKPNMKFGRPLAKLLHQMTCSRSSVRSRLCTIQDWTLYKGKNIDKVVKTLFWSITINRKLLILPGSWKKQRQRLLVSTQSDAFASSVSVSVCIFTVQIHVPKHLFPNIAKMTLVSPPSCQRAV